MTGKRKKGGDLSRREFLESTGLASLALSTGALSALPGKVTASYSNPSKQG